MSTPTPHDALFKQFLTHQDIAKDFLATHLPPALRCICDLNTLQLKSSSFIEPDMRTYYSDVLYSVKTSGKDGYIYALIEHQSTPDKFMAFRLMRYCVAAMDMHLRSGHDRLPLVVPLLFYHGDTSPYPCRTNWIDLFDQPDAAAEFYTHPFPLVDITVIPDEEILKHKRAALLEYLQKHIRLRDIVNLANTVVDLNRIWMYSQDLFASVLRYMLQVGETTQLDVFLDTVARGAPEHKETLMTAAQQLELRGLERGRVEGRMEGVQEGVMKVAYAMLEKGMDKATVLQLTGLNESDLDTVSQVAL